MNRLISDLIGTLKNTFRIGNLTLDASSLTASRVGTIQDTDGTFAYLTDISLHYFTDSSNVSGTNATIGATVLQVTSSLANADIVLSPKGTGTILAQLPDGSTTGGNKRGVGSVDFQMLRNDAVQVASGTYCFQAGRYNKVTGIASTCVGSENNSTGNYQLVAGSLNDVSGASSVCVGAGNSVYTDYAACFGSSCSVGGNFSVAFGYDTHAVHNYTVAMGNYAQSKGIRSFNFAANRLSYTGDAQFELRGIFAKSSGTTPIVMTSDKGTETYHNQISASPYDIATVDINFVAKKFESVSSNDCLHIKATLRLFQGTNASTTEIQLIEETRYGGSSTDTWVLAYSADTTNGSLKVTFTGAASTSVGCHLLATLNRVNY